MIVDKLANFARYAHLGKHFETAVAFVEATDLTKLPLGRTEVDGDNVFINVFETVYDRPDRFWEAHRKYADVQIVLAGCERFGWGGEVTFGEIQGDLIPCKNVVGFDFTLTEGQFAIFLPLEPHSPGNPAGEPAPCRKAVIKVLAAENG